MDRTDSPDRFFGVGFEISGGGTALRPLGGGGAREFESFEARPAALRVVPSYEPPTRSFGPRKVRAVLSTVLIPIALFFGVREGIGSVAPTLVSGFVGSKAETQALVRSVVSDQVTKTMASGGPEAQQAFSKAIEDTTLDEVRIGTRTLIAGMTITDDPVMKQAIMDTVVAEIKTGVQQKIAQTDVNQLITGAMDPALMRELLQPLANELPKIVAQKLDVNALLSNATSGNPATTQAFVTTLAAGLAVEVGKQVDLGPIVMQLLNGVLGVASAA